jgi:hypothetical protein
MHTEISNKILQWRKPVAAGNYTATECGQYYAYREGHLWNAGRVMFNREINFRVEFPSLASAQQFLQEYESNKVIIVGDPAHPVYEEGGLLHRKILGLA